MSGSVTDDRSVKQERILEAAEELLRRGGPGALSMRALARQADVGHVTPYDLFDSKHGVVLALLVREIASRAPLVTMGESGSAGEDGSVGEDGDDPLEDLLARQRALVDALAADEAYIRSLLLALDESAPPEERGRWLDFVDARTTVDLDRLVRSGLVRSDAPLQLTRRALLVGRDGALRRWFRGLSTWEQLRIDYLGTTLHALLAVATDAGRERLWGELVALHD